MAEKISEAQKAAQKWHALTTKLDVEPKQLSIRFGLSLKAPLVVGVETLEQFEENIQLFNQIPLTPDITKEIWNEMSPSLNENILNPTLWKK